MRAGDSLFPKLPAAFLISPHLLHQNMIFFERRNKGCGGYNSNALCGFGLVFSPIPSIFNWVFCPVRDERDYERDFDKTWSKTNICGSWTESACMPCIQRTVAQRIACDPSDAKMMTNISFSSRNTECVPRLCFKSNSFKLCGHDPPKCSNEPIPTISDYKDNKHQSVRGCLAPMHVHTHWRSFLTSAVACGLHLMHLMHLIFCFLGRG